MAYPSNYQAIRQIEILGEVGTARQLTASSASSNTALTPSVKRISMRAVGADIRYSVGIGTQTANGNTSNFIANGERLDIAVPANANIPIIIDGTINGTLQLTELF